MCKISLIMENELTKKIINNEYSFIRFFCKEIIKDNYIRFYDDKIRDMYDNNFTDLYGEMTPEIFTEIKKIKEERKEDFIKISSFHEIPELEYLGYNKETLLTMAADIVNAKPLKIKGIGFKNILNNPELINELLKIDLEYYASEYGKDFVGHRIYRYFHKINELKGLNYFVCCYSNKIIAYCYAYYSNGVVALDGLLVDKQFRNNNIASNLIKHVQQYYQNCPIYLHADEAESTKELYERLGFKVLYKKYDYLRLDSEFH